MAEVVEYSLVVLVSSLFVAGSVVVYNSFTSFESDLQLKATFAAVSNLASQAVVNGSAMERLSMPASTIACLGSSMTVSLGSQGLSQSLPVTCDFDLGVSSGVHTLMFRAVGARLNLSVR